MSVIRVEKNKNYTTMSNYHLKERKMSLKAKGLMSMMLSLPEDWDYSIAGLVAICKENETAIKTTLDELKEFGYLQVIKKMPNQTESGRFEYEYVLYEAKQEQEKQGIENLGVEILGLENQIQLNTNNQITDKLNTNNIKETTKEKKFTKPTLEEVQAYCKERNNNVDAERFIDFYTSKGWKVGNQPMKDWKACVRTWEKPNKYQSVQVEKKSGFATHKFSEEEINSLFDNLDEVRLT